MIRASIIFIIIGAFCPPVALAEPTAAEIAKRLTTAATGGATPQTLWNLGFIWTYEYGPTRAMAQILSQGYRLAKARDDEGRKSLESAAKYWNQEYQYWNKPRPRSRWQYNHNVYFWDRTGGKWEHTLPMAQPDRRRR